MADSDPGIGFGDTVVRLYPVHRAAALAALAALGGLNLWSGPPWWTFWPMLVLAALFTAHFMARRAITADERWADARADEIGERSYDRSHIESITDRYTRPPVARRTSGDDRPPPGDGATGR
ncbi:MAG: hypothetical protein R3D27_04970 [Hyphomicrobiaceae bacterium]